MFPVPVVLSSPASMSYAMPRPEIVTSGTSGTRSEPYLVVNRNISEVVSTTNVYMQTPIDGRFSEHFLKLKAIEKELALNQLGASTPSRSSIILAESVLRALEKDNTLPSRVVVSGEGGIAICFIHGDKYADIECLNTGDILGVISNRRDRPLVWDIGQGPASIARASAKIRQFLLETTTQKDDSGRSKSRSWLQRISPALL